MALHADPGPRHTGAMQSDRRNPRRGRARERGATLLETCAALALAASAIATVLAGLGPLSCAVKTEAARTVLRSTLLDARRAAYQGEANVVVDTPIGGSDITIRPPGSVRSLGQGVRVASGPADGSIQFRGSGLADNATVAVACGASTASVVVNQRGVVR